MLLQGATLVSEPCPYCKGVRVIKDGTALCASCGREPDKEIKNAPKQSGTVLETLEKKIEQLSKELEAETDHRKQQDIIKSIDSMMGLVSKLK